MTLSREEAALRAKKNREALLATIDALQNRLTKDSDRLEHAVSGAKMAITRSDRAVKRNPWLFVGGAIVVGLAIGLRKRRTTRLVAARSKAPVMMLPEPERPRSRGFFGVVLGFAAKSLLRGAFSALTSEGVLTALLDRVQDKPEHRPGPPQNGA
jgi:ElaB/YqjD/DUF883 family membrane-anchored ribosome-binding protein